LVLNWGKRAASLSPVMNHFPVRDINDLQFKIMVFIKCWANTQKTTIPQKEIIKDMINKGINGATVKYSLHSLINKGYIRRAWTEKQNTTEYVMIRNI
jgi:DNA-binding MarR family transcriptional regulator